MAATHSTPHLINILRDLAKAADPGIKHELQEAADKLAEYNEQFWQLSNAMEVDNGLTPYEIVQAAMRRFEDNSKVYVNRDPVFPGVLKLLKDAMDKHYPKAVVFRDDGAYIGTAATILSGNCLEKPDLNIGTLIALLHNQLRGMKGRREFSAAITKLQECGFWYQQGLREIEMDTQVEALRTDTVNLDLLKPWIHYVPVKGVWSAEEIPKAVNKYRELVKEQMANVRSFDNDLFLPEVDSKAARIVVLG